jgi:hypothetical protein
VPAVNAFSMEKLHLPLPSSLLLMEDPAIVPSVRSTETTFLNSTPIFDGRAA